MRTKNIRIAIAAILVYMACMMLTPADPVSFVLALVFVLLLAGSAYYIWR